MDPETLRAEVPAVGDTAYLNTGATGPAPRRVVEAAADAQRRHEFEAPAAGVDAPYESAWAAYADYRERIAAHLGTDGENVALTTSTADGIARVAAAMDWTDGDAVVRTDVEHPAGTLPFERLRREHGVSVRVVGSEAGALDRAAYREAVADDRTRLVCFSSIDWSSGRRLPVADLVDEAHDAGARVLVDAVQSPGQRPVDVEAWGADAVAAAGHKWLLGPWGAGVLYLDPEFARRLTPARLSYRSVTDPGSDDPELYPDARRFGVGTRSLAPHAGLLEGIETIESIGYDAVQDRVRRLTDRLKRGLGDSLRSPRAYESGLVAFDAPDGADPEAVVEGLAAEDVIVRTLPNGTIRASVHVFNDREDVDRLLAGLP